MSGNPRDWPEGWDDMPTHADIAHAVGWLDAFGDDKGIEYDESHTVVDDDVTYVHVSGYWTPENGPRHYVSAKFRLEGYELSPRPVEDDDWDDEEEDEDA